MFDELMQSFSLLKNSGDKNTYIVNLETDTCSMSERLAKKLGVPSQFPNAFETLLSLVIETDRVLYLSVINLVKKRKRKDFMIEYRINTKETSLRANNKATVVTDPKTKQDYVVGRLLLEDSKEQKDLLTNLYNFTDCLHDYETHLRIQKQISGFLLKLDIDNMSIINERQGKDIGDKVIQSVAKCARRACSKESLVYRGIEDDLIILNCDGGTENEAERIYSTIKRYINETMFEIEYKVIFTISAGLVSFNSTTAAFTDLLQRANFALQDVKDCGKNNLKTFNYKEYKKHLDKFDLQEQLRMAIKNNYQGFKLFYQPVIDATKIKKDTTDFSKSVVFGAEALLRWEHPNFGLLGAVDIIPILEEFNLIVPLGRWILLTACKQCKEWNEYLPNFKMSINLSYIQIRKSDITFDIKTALDKSKVNPKNIVLEITESGSLEAKELIPLLKDLRELEVGIDIDDFGTGYSNMRYLQEMQADTLKLDYTIIQNAVKGNSKKDRIVVDHIAKLAKDLNMKICMEGIESPEDVKKLLDLTPNKFQGFLFGQPMDAESFWKDKIQTSINAK